MTASVVLLSGGLDSAVCVARVREEGRAVIALTVDYGQAWQELRAAGDVARVMGVAEHVRTKVDLLRSALRRKPGADSAHDAYIPARNTVLLAIGLAVAEDRGANDVVIGAIRNDTGFPDCTASYFAAAEALAEEGLHRAISIVAPLLRMSKRDVVIEAMRLRVPIGLTVSCYRPTISGEGCGRCLACRERSDAMDIDEVRP